MRVPYSLFYLQDLTSVDGLKQKSCKNSENILELMICLKNKTLQIN